MPQRSFTPDEQHRLERRVSQLDRSFVWTAEVSLKERMRRFLGKAMPCIILSACVVASALIVAWQFVSAMTPFIAVSVLVGYVLAVFLVCLVAFAKADEVSKMSPPVFVFADDKLYKIESTDDFVPLLPEIPVGEMIALREKTGAITSAMSSFFIRAEVMYLDVIENFEIGNETKGLSISVIDNIVDIEQDENDETRFVIEYEKDGDVVETILPMDKWRNLYEWLYAQMYED